MPKIKTEIGPLYPKFSEDPYKINIKANDVKIVFIQISFLSYKSLCISYRSD